MKLSELTEMSPTDIVKNMELIEFKPITKGDSGDICKVILEYRPKEDLDEKENLFRRGLGEMR